MSATVSATGAPSRESARGAALDVRDRQRGFTGRTVQTGIFGPDRRETRPQEPFLGRFLRRDRAECLKALESTVTAAEGASVGGFRHGLPLDHADNVHWLPW